MMVVDGEARFSASQLLSPSLSLSISNHSKRMRGRKITICIGVLYIDEGVLGNVKRII